MFRQRPEGLKQKDNKMLTVYKRFIVLAAAMLALVMVTGATTGDILNMNYNAKVNIKDLGGDERYLMYVSTDKPVYRSGETIYARAVFLNAKDNTPYSGTNCIARAITFPHKLNLCF